MTCLELKLTLINVRQRDKSDVKGDRNKKEQGGELG